MHKCMSRELDGACAIGGDGKQIARIEVLVKELTASVRVWLQVRPGREPRALST